MSDDEDFFLDSDESQDDGLSVEKKNKLAVETPVVDKLQESRLSKPKPTPIYRAEVIEDPPAVRQVSLTDDDDGEPALSQLLKDPEFYDKLANAVRIYPALYDCGHPRFRTNLPNRMKLWTKVAKAVHFRGSAADLEAEWKALGINYRHWFLERAQKKISSYGDEIEDVFLSMKWAQEKLVPWFERSPLFVALLHVKEKHEAKEVWPTKRRRETAEEGEAEKSVYDVPEREPAESPVRKRQSRPSTEQTPRLEFPKRPRPKMGFPESATPKSHFDRSPLLSRLRESTLRERSQALTRRNSASIREFSRDSSPDDVFSSPEKAISELSSSPDS